VEAGPRPPRLAPGKVRQVLRAGASCHVRRAVRAEDVVLRALKTSCCAR